MEKIVVISDSHGEHIFDKHPLFEVRHIGPRTAFKLRGHSNLVYTALEGIFDCKIVFVFGEIDCRKHIILKANEYNRHPFSLVKDTALSYVNFVYSLCKEGYNIGIFNVVPPGEVTTGCQGTWKERTIITRYMNDRLKTLCKSNGIEFIDIYSDLIDSNGFRREDLISDEAHLNSKVADIFLENYKDYIDK